jgi:hypothetical protein
LLYFLILAMIYGCAFGLPFATKRMDVSIIFFVVSVILFIGSLQLGSLAHDPEREFLFLKIFAFSAIPFAAGALARVVSLRFFANRDREWIYVLPLGIATSVLFMGITYLSLGVIL